MSTSNNDLLHKPQNIVEQQFIHINLLCRTRSNVTRRKQLFLSQQQAKKVE